MSTACLIATLRKWPSVTAALLLLVTCEPALEHRPDSAVPDDTPTIAQQSELTSERAPTGLELVSTIGGLTGPGSGYDFGRIEGIIADREGAVFVADGVGPAIAVFAANGRFLRKLGRKGSGPGEFRGLHGLVWLGDTLVALDYGNARLALLARDGTQLGQWPWLQITGAGRFFFNGGLNEFYVQSYLTSPDASGRLHPVWLRYASQGVTDSLEVPRVDDPPGTQTTCTGNGIGVFDNPFGKRFIARPAPHGLRVVAWNSAYRLLFLDSAGDTVRVLSRHIDPQSVPDSAWAPVEADYERFLDSWRGDPCEGSIERPDVLPILLDVYFDHRGRMLVEYNHVEGVTFDLYDVAGQRLTSFRPPPERDRTVPPFLRDNRLYVVTKDPLDVQQVRMYQLSVEDSE